MPIRMLKKDEDTNREKGLKKSKMLVGGQAKLDKNKNNKIDAEDFKILKAEKAKGRGQGLQDEKMKPGKVKPVKAVLGIATMGLMGAKYLKDRKKKAAMVPGIGAAGAIEKKKKEILGKKKGGMFKGYSKVFETAAKAGQKNTGTSTIVGVKPKLPEASKKSKIARRALRAAKATRLGKMVLPIAAAGVAAQQYLKSKMKKKEKKMGGGMMRKPMGYKTGTVIEKYSPGTEGKIQKAANERLKDIKRNKRTEKNPRASGAAKKAAKKQTAFYQSGATDQMGGPFKKPISKYNVGGSVTVKTKLGRNKPTKMY